MAAAAAQSTVNLSKFGGSSTDNWTDFESLFHSIVEVTGVADAQSIFFTSYLFHLPFPFLYLAVAVFQIKAVLPMPFLELLIDLT